MSDEKNTGTQKHGRTTAERSISNRIDALYKMQPHHAGSNKAGFALATSGALALMSTGSAQAAIQYTAGTRVVTMNSQTINIDGQDLKFGLTQSTNTFTARANPGANFFGAGQYAQNFAFSETISGNPIAGNKKIFWYYWATNNFSGNFDNLNTGYLGFKLDSGNFGWAHVSSIAANGSSYTIDGWAYEDTGAAIKAGDQGGASGAVPEPTSLALLACGAAGVYALRRKRMAAAEVA